MASDESSSNTFNDSVAEKRPGEDIESLAGDKRPYKRFEITSEDEKYRWFLPDSMAEYANKFFEKFISDKELKEAVLLQCPVPDNIHPVRKMTFLFVNLY